MKVKLDQGAYAPERAHRTDAGLDIRTPVRVMVPARGSAVVHTGVHVQLPPFYAGEIISKSGLNIRNGIVTTGLIDEGFDGEIVVKLYNLSDDPHVFEAGDKITQLMLVRTCYSTVQVVDEIEGGERGSDGYGSTGR